MPTRTPAHVALTITVLVLLLGGHAEAISLVDGRVEVHGFYEMQIRGIARDFDASDDWDLTQFAHVVDLEFEIDLIRDGAGPFDLVSLFARVEVRYDCVWTRACGLFPGANAFGDGAKKLPKRLNDGRRTGYSGNSFLGDTRHYRGEPLETFRLPSRDRPDDSRRPYAIDRTEAFYLTFLSPGPDSVLGTADDPAPFVYSRYFGNGECKFSSRYLRGFTNGVGLGRLGPIDPACDVEPIAAFADKPNPFRPGDIHPLYGTGGSLALPYRPATEVSNHSSSPDYVPRGLWIPNKKLRELIRDGEIEDPEVNFSQNELSWNRGASQQDEKELKELYFDIEVLDSRLWLRLGKQQIVWGKTELFRSQDQFNPQDLALASLPSLEESRIGLWALRGVWSFYDVGPLQDVRLELAANFDQFEPNDFGRCGEPYSVVLLCEAQFGIMSHGFEGLGLAGVRNPPNPWDDIHGVEAGVRLEFRWERFAFAITDFYGFSDIPSVEKIFTFERNVDPLTGRPRRLNERGRCKDGDDPACLGPGRDALLNSSVNQTLFAKNCAATVGFVDLDPTACGPALFNSQVKTDPTEPFAPRLMIGLTNVFAGHCIDAGGGQYSAGCGVYTGLAGFTDRTFADLQRFPYAVRTNGVVVSPLVPLIADPWDGGPDPVEPEFDEGDFSVRIWTPTGVSPHLTDEQEALLGCGAYYDTKCDIHGIDIMNAEASAIAQSWPGIEGTLGDWYTTDTSVAQPGTTGFEGGPACTRYENGKLYTLPGCRGPGDPDYDPKVDGTTGGAVHPFTGQKWKSEMAIVSWNIAVGLVGFSASRDGSKPEIDQFDPDDAFRKGACSFAQVQFCQSLSEFFIPFRSRRDSIRAGGNGRFGRRDFQWHGGTPLLLRYDKRNVLGASVDFAEDLTKTNWSLEFTWIEGLTFGDNDEESGVREADTYNLVVSVDRPTFVNFLNANRTFFINAQGFVQYVDGYRAGFQSNGPWNFLATLTITTGYFRDRLMPAATFVYDMNSNSGAFLGQVTYRFTESFSATVGAALFMGRVQAKRGPVNPVASLNPIGRGRNNSFVENGLSVLRDRDEAFLKVRFTF